MLDTWSDATGIYLTDSKHVHSYTAITISENKEILNIDDIPTILMGENNTQAITFEMSRYADEIDLSALQIQVLFQIGNDLSTKSVYNVQVTTDTMRFIWVIDDDVTQAPLVPFSILVTGKVDGTSFTWKSLPSALKLKESLNHNHIKPIKSNTWYTDFTLQMQNYLGQSQKLKEDVGGLRNELSGIQNELSGQQNKLDERIANITNNATTMSEVIDARGNYTILKNRLDSMEDLSDRLSGAKVSWVNVVEKYKIDNTGTTDVATKLQSIIDSVDEFTTLYFPRGRYLFQNSITINKKIQLLGDTKIGSNVPRMGYGATEFFTTSKPNVIMINLTQKKVSIQNICFYSDSCKTITNTAESSPTNQHLHYEIETIYQNVNAICCGLDGEGLSNFENIYISGFSGVGIEVPRYSTCNNIVVFTCGLGIKLDTDSTLSSSKVWGCGIGVKMGVGCTISNTRIEEISKYGIYSTGTGQDKLSNITIDQCGYSGIFAETSLSNTVFTGKISRCCQYYFGFTYEQYNSAQNKIVGGFSSIYFTTSGINLNFTLANSNSDIWDDTTTTTHKHYVIDSGTGTSSCIITAPIITDYVTKSSSVTLINGKGFYTYNVGTLYCDNGVIVQEDYENKDYKLRIKSGKLYVYNKSTNAFELLLKPEVGFVITSTTNNATTIGYAYGGTWESVGSVTVGTTTVYYYKKTA